MRGWFRASTLVVLGAVLVGGTLRVLGTSWGLPLGLHPDEWTIVQGALDLAQRNSFEPSLFLRPDHVEIKLSFLAYTLYAVILHGVPVPVAYADDPATFLLISRLITAVLGTAMIVMAALIGRRFSRPVGAIAAVLFAIFPPFVLSSHYATPDIPLALASMIVILALMYYVSKPGYVSLLVASAGVSLSIAIKYPGAISATMIAIVVVVLAIRDRRPLRILSHGAAAIAGVVAFLFTISPVLFTNVTGVIAAIQKEARTEHSGADGLGWGGNLLFYAEGFFLVAGVLLTAISILGVVLAIRMRALVALPLALGFLTWVILSAVALHWDRWAIPMYLSPLLFASVGGWYAYRFVGQRYPEWRWRRLVTIIVSALVLLNLAAGSVATVARLLATDSRNEAAQTFADLGITPDNSVDEGYSPLVPNGPMYLDDVVKWEDGRIVPAYEGKKFILLSSCLHDRFWTAEKYADERAMYDAIRSDYPLELTVETVPARQRTGIEPWNVATAIAETAAFANGGLGGCTLEVYRITD
ncbi:hypothetical protein HDC94_002715 [Leifsonia sp. AK011]|uniref:glycosyltransferase family 39 protein n=1 Tax=Leifsonia sp. AK011 TaxID=2723075 RepID=UPI0015C70AC8|nr:glycosyltransferase family 39 protein [Leifsonia sp. AK011]NYF11559.1 hypothetical protein [Leifsonia sp. AK011]